MAVAVIGRAEGACGCDAGYDGCRLSWEISGEDGECKINACSEQRARGGEEAVGFCAFFEVGICLGGIPVH